MSATIFGMLNIGFGLLGLMNVLLSSMFDILGAMAANPAFNWVAAFLATLNHNLGYILWNQIAIPLNAAASLLQVAAGIGLLLLKNWARLASIGCGVYKILFVMFNIAVLWLALGANLATAMQGAGAILVVFLGLAGFVGTVLTLVYPVLLIYFLTRPKAVQAFQPAPSLPL